MITNVFTLIKKPFFSLIPETFTNNICLVYIYILVFPLMLRSLEGNNLNTSLKNFRHYLPEYGLIKSSVCLFVTDTSDIGYQISEVHFVYDDSG